MNSKNDYSKIKELKSLAASGQLYFAYGSNTNLGDFKSKTGTAMQVVGKAIVADACLVFDRYSVSRKGGVLSLKDCPGRVVEGLLMVPDSWQALDEKEGAPRCYTRVPITVMVGFGGVIHELTAWTYITTKPVAFVPPHPEYREIVMQGYAEHDISTDALEQACQNKRGSDLQYNNMFTYGTLCREESRENVMRKNNLTQVGLAEMCQGEIYACSGGAYPGLVQTTEGGHRPVLGELWSYSGGLSASHLHQLDTIEGHLSLGLRETVDRVQAYITNGNSTDEACLKMQMELESLRSQSLYRRIFSDVAFGSRGRQCWAYVFNQPTTGLHKIESGNWRDYCGRWHRFVQKLAFEFIEKKGGFESARAALSHVMYAPDFSSFEDLVEKIKSGEIDERDLIRAMKR